LGKRGVGRGKEDTARKSNLLCDFQVLPGSICPYGKGRNTVGRRVLRGGGVVSVTQGFLVNGFVAGGVGFEKKRTKKSWGGGGGGVQGPAGEKCSAFGKNRCDSLMREWIVCQAGKERKIARKKRSPLEEWNGGGEKKIPFAAIRDIAAL